MGTRGPVEEGTRGEGPAVPELAVSRAHLCPEFSPGLVVSAAASTSTRCDRTRDPRSGDNTSPRQPSPHPSRRRWRLVTRQ